MDKSKPLTLTPLVKEILGKIWIPPHQAVEKIQDMIKEIPKLSEYKVIVSGETDNISLYLIGEEEILIYTPFMDFNQNVIISEISPRILAAWDENLCLIERTEDLMDRLKLPKVILVNPWLKEVLPNPHLNLSVASLASYLRKYQKADVRILDMQLGITIDEIVKEVKDKLPDIFGISIRFGYFHLSTEILRRVSSELGDRKPLMIAGGPPAPLGYEKLLQEFPNLIICNGEGEKTMVDLAEYTKGNKRNLSEVSGITYIENGEIKGNPTKEIEMDDLPLPAMDTLEGLAENEGNMLAMETSRGCSYNACTFCPRKNMPKKWKEMSPPKVLRQMEYYKKIFDNFDIEPTIYLADEDFIGRKPDRSEARRIIEIMQGVVRNNFDKMFFYSIDARMDQIYNPKQSKEWHIERMKMLDWCKRAMGGFFMLGVESGSSTVLKRLNKRIEVNDSVMSFRILTSLGIDCRGAFINFDPLMSFEELKGNVLFLEREDMLLRPADLSKITYSELFNNLHDEEYVEENLLHQPFYERVGFMTPELQVLMGSSYVKLVKEAELSSGKELFIGEPDYDKAMYRVRFLDERVADIALAYRKWFEKNWVLDGTLRQLMYATSGKEGKEAAKFRTDYKRISFHFLKSLVWLFDEENTLGLDNNIVNAKELMQLKEKKGIKERKEIIANLMEIFNQKMHLLVNDVEEAINEGIISDGNNNLKLVIERWRREPQLSLI